MKSAKSLLTISVVLLAGTGSVQARADDAEFEGLYVGATIGGAFQGSDNGSSIVFDRNLDGS
jgi:outer membrane immunogenic protein